jgi:hypothetical protein
MAAITRAAALAALAVLAGCGTSAPGSPAAGGASPASTVSQPAVSAPAASPSASGPAVCGQPGTYLTAIRTGRYSTYDRVAFEFSGAMPAYTIQTTKSVLSDPKGTPVPLAGRQALHLVFHNASAICQQPMHNTYTGPAVLKPSYPQLLMVSAAGDFENVLSFGIGLANQGSYRAYPLTGPSRLAIDLPHP